MNMSNTAVAAVFANMKIYRARLSGKHFHLPLNKRLVDSNECILKATRSPLNIWLFMVPQIAGSLK